MAKQTPIYVITYTAAGELYRSPTPEAYTHLDAAICQATFLCAEALNEWNAVSDKGAHYRMNALLGERCPGEDMEFSIALLDPDGHAQDMWNVQRLTLLE